MLPHAEDVRGYVRTVKAANGRVATSIYGTGKQDKDGGISDLYIESIDLVDPSRAGVEFAVAKPSITAEATGAAMKNKNKFQAGLEELLEMGMKKADFLRQMAKKAEMGMDDFMKLLNGDSDLPDDLYEGLSAEMGAMKKQFTNKKESDMTTDNLVVQEQQTQAVRELTLRVQTLEAQLRDLTQMRQLLGIGEGVDAVLTLQNRLMLQSQLERENGDLLQETITAVVAKDVKLEAARPMVVSLIAQQKPTRRTDIAVAMQNVLARPEVKEMLKLSAVQEMGSPHQPAPNTAETKQPLFDIPTY